MRGRVDSQSILFHAFHIDDLVPEKHPLREIKARADAILKSMSPIFEQAYTQTGAPSVPPERLIKALLLRALFGIRSESQLVEQIRYNFLFRWFLDLKPTDDVFVQETFSMNRERFEQHGFVRIFFDRVVKEAILEGLVSQDHFSVDGTLIQSYASIKSLRPIDSPDAKVSDGADDDDPGNPTVNFRDEKRSNATHRSLTDPEARLARKGKGQPALLSHSGHLLMENRNGLCLAVAIDEANPACERTQAEALLAQVRKTHRLRPRTLGADGNYKAGEFLATMEKKCVKVHVPMPKGPIRGLESDDPRKRRAAQARRRARRRMETKGYAISQRIRKRIEELIGWFKQMGGLSRTWLVGRSKILQQLEATAAASNLLRMARLTPRCG